MQTRNECSRRQMMRTLGLCMGAASLRTPAGQAAPARRLKVGQTSINWGFKVESVEPGLRDSAKLGYWGYESYNDAVEPIEENPGWGKLLEQYKIPMPSSYFNFNLTDPTVRKAQVEKAIRLGKILKKHGGITAVIGPNGVSRTAYDFKAAKNDLVITLNEVSKALTDLGLAAALHQHTGTCVDTRDQVYAVFDAVDTRVVKFGPDVGQLQKSGTDPLPMLKDFQSLLRTVHLKDFVGERAWAGYCPLGMGKVDLPAVMDVLEKAEGLQYVMVELDGTPGAPLAPFECARTSKEHLAKLGYTFRPEMA
ncbi:MAG: sugar phosphate isomerase/epimerase [Candidatus Solibacter sp.]|nr:sugar phosphate isomerase/epimerase [Candidatus Solibacter sp.]